MSRFRVPERWVHCPRKALYPIDKFIAFKTPLSSNYDEVLQLNQRFTPSMILELTKERQWRIGLWIDLTNTSRYYDSTEVKNGYDDNVAVSYFKMPCLGRPEAPPEEITKFFIHKCRQFISQNPLQYIGVHCTHGFNRTGFLIAAFLVEEMHWEVKAAIQAFAKARPPGIYKSEYIEELIRRYGDDDDICEVPILPDWCTEQEEASSDEGPADDDDSPRQVGKHSKRGSSDHGPHKKMKKSESIPQFMEGVNQVTPVMDKAKAKSLKKKATEMCGFSGKGFPGSQPVSMNNTNIKFLTEKPYRVSWKADGTRYMMLIVKEKQVYFLDRDNNVFEISGLTFVNRKNLNEHLTNTLLDGEMVIDKYEQRDIPRYLIYDIVALNGKNFKNSPFFPERLQLIEADVIHPRTQAIRQGKIDRLSEPFGVRAKPFLSIDKSGSYLSEKFCKQLLHEPDGLIFQPSLLPYHPGPCEFVLKWKPPLLNSVDFRLEIEIEKRLGYVEGKVCKLCVAGNSHPFDYMKYNKKLMEYNKKIIECSYNQKLRKWEFLRERKDKSFPNGYDTAKAVCESIKDPVTEKDLLEFIRTKSYDLMPPPPTS